MDIGRDDDEMDDEQEPRWLGTRTEQGPSKNRKGLQHEPNKAPTRTKRARNKKWTRPQEEHKGLATRTKQSETGQGRTRMTWEQLTEQCLQT